MDEHNLSQLVERRQEQGLTLAFLIMQYLQMKIARATPDFIK